MRYKEDALPINDLIIKRINRYYILEKDHKIDIYGIQIIELSDIFGMAYSTVYGLVDQDEIRQFDYKRRVYIVTESLLNYLASHHMWDKYHTLTDKIFNVRLSIQDFMDTYWN